jgi:hypothetical protein
LMGDFYDDQCHKRYSEHWYMHLPVVSSKCNGLIPKYQCRCTSSYTVSYTWGRRMNGWLLFNANSAIFQLYYGENKLIFNEMKIIFPICSRPTRWVGFL